MKNTARILCLAFCLSPVLAALLPAQNLLFPGQTTPEMKGTISWKLEVEPTPVAPGGEIAVKASYDIPTSFYIYAPDHDPEKGPGLPMGLTIDSKRVSAVGKPVFPEPDIKEEESLNWVFRILKGKGSITQRYKIGADTPPGKIELPVTLKGQRCDPSMCWDEKFAGTVTVTVSSEPIGDGSTSDATATVTPTTDSAVSSEAPKGSPDPTVKGDQSPGDEGDSEPLIAEGSDLGQQPLWLFVLAMIGGGLFALAMPCTYPMIPITISYFAKQAEARHGAVLPLALAYGAGIIAVFNVVGIVFAGVIRDFAFHPVTNLVFCLAFVVFALSLFGLFNIRLPSSVNNLAGRVSGVGGYLGVFLLGTVLVVTSFTCTAPVMGGLLIMAGGEGNLARISLGMTVFGATMAVPFVFLSLFPARVRNLPSAGEWMHVLKVSLGFLELAAALKFFSNVDIALEWEVLPRELFLLLWAGIFTVGGLYLLNLFKLDGDTGASIGPRRMLTGLCTVLLGLYFFWGALGYQLDWISNALAPDYSAERVAGSDPWNPKGGKQAAKEKWVLVKDDLDAGLALAREQGKHAFINFTGRL